MKALRTSLFILFLAVTAFAVDPTWTPAGQTIRTRWAKEVNPGSVWPEYPRPIMSRAAWSNLNGLWEYAVTPKTAGKPGDFEGSILVPFAIESALSGVGKAVGPDQALWYRRSFQIPTAWKGKNVLLHFGAVDWETTIYVNGRQVGVHKGGYDPFTFDISEFTQHDGPQEIVIRVWDPT
ncbi:MAG: sugar-binding domain-containing protein, partial [Acidobacteriota bacterium]